MNAIPPPPPTPWDEPPVAYEVTVRTCSDFLIVEARLMHRSGQSGQVANPGGFSGESVTVDEPCWLFRLFGDTTEARIERAKAKVARRAERELAKRRRLAAVAEVQS